MSVKLVEPVGFWKYLWRGLVGSPTDASATEAIETRPTNAPITPAVFVEAVSFVEAVPSVVDAIVAATSLAYPVTTARPRNRFMLSARLASAHALNAPKSRRDGKSAAARPGPTNTKPKPKTPATTAKKVAPARHVWLAARPEGKPSAEIVRLAGRRAVVDIRQGATRRAA